MTENSFWNSPKKGGFYTRSTKAESGALTDEMIQEAIRTIEDSFGYYENPTPILVSPYEMKLIEEGRHPFYSRGIKKYE